jgi:hypothetical protein
VGTSKNHGEQGSHNKPIGCSASGVYAPGPDVEEEKQASINLPELKKEKSVAGVARAHKLL